MIKQNKPMIARIHICCFESFNNNLKTDLQKYLDRLCIIDEEKDIVVDVETRHQYKYVRTVSMLYFLNELETKKIIPGKRFGCFKYDNSLIDVSSDELKECKKIIDLLKQGYEFPNGNDVLTNEEYLELINRPKIEEQPKKLFKIGKKSK